jgi:hypothetical protein
MTTDTHVRDMGTRSGTGMTTRHDFAHRHDDDSLAHTCATS